MHFLEALNLAQHINRTRPSWTIVSIGRFKPIGEIRLGMPWGISVLEPGSDPESGSGHTTNEAAMIAAPDGMLF